MFKYLVGILSEIKKTVAYLVVVVGDSLSQLMVGLKRVVRVVIIQLFVTVNRGVVSKVHVGSRGLVPVLVGIVGHVLFVCLELKINLYGCEVCRVEILIVVITLAERVRRIRFYLRVVPFSLWCLGFVNFIYRIDLLDGTTNMHTIAYYSHSNSNRSLTGGLLTIIRASRTVQRISCSGGHSISISRLIICCSSQITQNGTIMRKLPK